jgi:Flp pilus assembly protein CpaB
MSGRRLIAILVGVVGLIILAVVVLVVILGGGGAEPEQAPPPVVAAGATAVPGAEPTATVDPNIRMVEVVVSLQTVPRGWLMTEAELTTDMRPATDVTSNMILQVEDAVGLYARHEIYQGETLTADSLSRDPTLEGSDYFGPSSLIPSGWVAMAVPMDRLNSIAYAYLPGDTVDIMLSFTLNQLDQEFQTLLSNSATFYLQQSTTTEAGTTTTSNVFVIDPYGRFETLPSGDLAHIAPSDSVQRPVPVSVILQNARIVQVGEYYPPVPPIPPTPTPDPDEPTPTPGGGPPPTPTPPPPEVVLIALPPQQQLFLKYAVETTADIDFALRSSSDGQLYSVQQVDAAYLLEQFGIQVPPNSEFAVGGISSTSADAEELSAPAAETGQ